jgi:hypothetical protein
MKLKLIILLSIFLVSGYSTKAQLLDKLKERAKEKGYQTRDVSFDSTDNAKNRTSSNEAEELVINSAKDFFTTDVIMKLYYETNAVISTQYFDADVIAMRTEFPDPTQKPLFQDRKGLMYAYNEKEKVYEKASIAPSSYMGFMMAGMIPKYYKLPAEPYLEAFGKLQEKDITLSFLALELAFVYKPSDFEDDSYYTPSKTKCNTSNNCTKFSYNDPEYPGSYILFDDQGRLSELYTHTTNPELGEEDHPTGKFVYTYKDVTVKLPDAVEKSMMPEPFKMLKLERGLEPWKYNKKDKQKN